MELVTERKLRDALPLQNAMAALVAVLAIAALLSLGKDLFVPIALALLLSFALAPVAAALEGLGLGRATSVVLTVLAFLAIIATVAYVLYAQAIQLALELPAYRNTIRDKLQLLSASIGGQGPFTRFSEMMTEMTRDLGGSAPAGSTTVVVAAPDAGGLGALRAASGPVVHALATTGVVVLITVFTLLQRTDLRNRVIKLIGAEDIQQTTALLDDVGSRLGRLLLAQLLVNFIFAVIVGAALWLIGLPSPFLWGILAAVLRYVPYVGAILGVAPPLLLAFAVDPTWSTFLWTLAFFAIFEPLVGHVIEPLLYGSRTGLSPFAVITSITVWAFLWGTIGLILAIPLTICLVVLGRHVARLSFLDTLLGDSPPLPPHEILYQRLLAGDPRDASRNALAILSNRALTTYYDHVMLPGLRLAHLDITRGAVAGDRLDRLVKAGASVIDTLSRSRPNRIASRRLDAEVADVLERLEEPTKGDLPGRMLSPKGEVQTIGILYGTHPLDRLVAAMLSHVLESYGLNVLLQEIGASSCDRASRQTIDLIVLSFIEPLSVVHMRACSMAARKAAPGCRMILMLWQEMTDDRRETLGRRLQADGTGNSLRHALEVITKALNTQGVARIQKTGALHGAPLP